MSIACSSNIIIEKWRLLCHWGNRIGSRNVTGISANTSDITSHVTEISSLSSDIGSHLLLLQCWQSYILSVILQFNVTVRYRMNKTLYLKRALSQLSPASHQVNLRSVQYLLSGISAIPLKFLLFLISSIRPVVTMEGTLHTAHSAHCTQNTAHCTHLRVSDSFYFLTHFPDIPVTLSGISLSADNISLWSSLT